MWSFFSSGSYMLSDFSEYLFNEFRLICLGLRTLTLQRLRNLWRSRWNLRILCLRPAERGKNFVRRLRNGLIFPSMMLHSGLEISTFTSITPVYNRNESYIYRFVDNAPNFILKNFCVRSIPLLRISSLWNNFFLALTSFVVAILCPVFWTFDCISCWIWKL